MMEKTKKPTKEETKKTIEQVPENTAGNKTKRHIPAFFKWLGLGIASAILGSFVTYAESHYAFPVWAKITRPFTGKICCYKAPDPTPVPVFSRSMSKRLEVGYVINYSPEAAKVDIGPGSYDCKRSYLNLVSSVLDRNAGNLVYSVDPKKRVIHISTP